MKQFEQASAKPKVKGSVLYSAKNLVENKVGIADAVKAIYGKKVLPPYLGRTAAVLPPAPDNIRRQYFLSIYSHDRICNTNLIFYQVLGTV